MRSSQITSSLKESNTSAQRLLALAEETKSLGSEINHELKKQGEQIKRIQGDVDDISCWQEEAEKHLSALEGSRGWFSKFKSSPRKPDHVKQGDRELEKSGKPSSSARQRGADRNTLNPANPDYSDLSGLDSEEKQLARQTDNALDKTHQVLKDLKQIAIEQGKELEEHNLRLSILQGTVEDATKTADDQTRRVKSLRR